MQCILTQANALSEQMQMLYDFLIKYNENENNHLKERVFNQMFNYYEKN